MSQATHHSTPSGQGIPSREADGDVPMRAVLKAGALQNAILTSANFSIIATDEQGIVQLFNVGAERMLGYAAHEVVNRISPSDIHDPEEVAPRAPPHKHDLGNPNNPRIPAHHNKA